MEITVDQALQQGVAAHKEGKLQEAERLYRAILQSQPRHPDANHTLGVLAVSLNKTESALPLFKTAVEVNPNIEQFWISYINALIIENQFVNSKQVLEQGKKTGLAGEKVEALSHQLMSATKEQAPPRAELNSLLEHYQNGRYDDAEKSAISITQQFPRHQFGWKVLGEVLKHTGRISEALVASQKAVGIDPNDAEAHSNLGNTLRELGRLEEAEASYGKAIALKPDYAEAHSNLGNTLQELGRLEEAEASYRNAIALKPDFTQAHYNLGNALQDLGRLEEAAASHRKTIELKPGYGLALLRRGQNLFDKGEFSAALRDFDLCNTEDSRARAFTSLYALGRIKDIYKRIETQSEVDDGNIGIAAFSSFIAEREKKDTAHNFCKNPIDFIHFSNI